jgi:sterol desaturase/sphingolipid hydroxylase (fatty acid hydroxylase superfamily)
MALDRMSYAILVVALSFAALLALERLRPLRSAKRPWLARLWVNAAVGTLALATATILVKPVASVVLDTTTRNAFGVATLVPFPPWGQAIVAFLLLDLSFYYWHRANHVWPLLWRFHNVHHIDPDLDVSTSFRFHFVEIACSAGFRAVQIALIGGPLWAFAAYELAFQLNTLFQHSNVRLPISVERGLNLVIVTPRMHGIHHSQMRAETDSNWSTVLSCWDRLHGTLRLNVPQTDIEIGVPAYAQPEDNRVTRVLAMPFEAQRDYWRTPGQTRSERAGADGDQRRLAA